MEIRTEIEKVKKCFEPDVWIELMEFLKRLSSITPTPDVMIFTARKAISFFDAMKDIGILNIGCFITSDRILDQDLGWLVGKRVTIVDESIVSGTTLNRLIDKLNKVSINGEKIKSLEILAYSINKDYFEKELLKDYVNSYRLKENIFYLKTPYQELSNSFSIKFSSDIVTALTVMPRPYCVDFPIYEKKVISKSYFSFMINNSEWDSDDISSNFQKSNNTFAITLTPNSTASSEFDKIVGCNLSRQSLLKIRVYGSILDEDRVELQFVPMVIMQPILISEVEILFQQIVKKYKADEIKPLFLSNTAKLRLFQYLTSSFLLKSFFNQFSESLRKMIEPKITKEKIQYVFHPNSISKIIEICSSSSILFNNFKITSVNIPNLEYDEIKTINSESNDIFNIQSALTEPFIRLYNEKEIKSRELVLLHKNKVFNKSEYKNIINRLQEGYSIIDLNKILEPIKDKIDTKRIVSIFLDKSIDRGIIVPILANNNSKIYYRAFRHGEDVLFGIKEENLCAQLFKKYIEVTDKKNIDHLWAEKMLVFFIKYGVKLEFLSQKFDEESNNAYRISIKNYLHGPVAVKNNQYDYRTYLNPENQTIWLTSILVNKAILSKPYEEKSSETIEEVENISSEEIFENAENYNKNRKYKVNNIPIHDFHDNQTVNNAKKIGDIFGQLKRNASRKETPRLKKDIDLAILAACLTPDTVCGALAAEVNLFQYHWSELTSYLTSVAPQRTEDYLNIAENLKKNDLYTAINSGQVKFFSFIDRVGEKIIKNIQTDYEGTGYEYVWAELWPQNINWTYESISSNLISIIQIMGLYFITTNIYIRIFYICLALDTIGEKKSIDKEIKDLQKYKEKIIRCEQISNEIISIKEHKRCFENYLKYFNFEKIQQNLPKYIDDFIAEIGVENIDKTERIKYLYNSINKLVNYSAKKILSKVDETISLYGKTESSKRYNNILFFTFEKNSTKLERAEGWRKFSEVKEEFFHYNQHDIYFLDIPMEQNKLRYGRFLCISSKNTDNIFVIIHKFLIELTDFNVRIVLFPDLSEEYSIIQMNDNSNQDISTNFFFDIATPIINSLVKDFNRKEFVLVRNENYKQKFEIPKYLKSRLNYNSDKLHDIYKPIHTKHKSFTYLFNTVSQMKNDVFISYNHKDISCVEKVKDFLKNHNVSITIDSEKLTIGDSIHQFIKSSVKNTSITLSFVSTKSIESVWVALESAYTLQLAEFSDKRFIACLLDHKIFEPEYKIEIVNLIDEKLKTYQELINISLEKGIGIEDYAEDLKRYKNLRDNIDKIINYIKTHLALDLTQGISDVELNKLLKAIKPSR